MEGEIECDQFILVRTIAWDCLGLPKIPTLPDRLEISRLYKHSVVF